MVKQKTGELFPEAVKIRRQLHQFPEPCFKENKTSRFIADYLRKCGLEVHTGIAGTGIKAVLRGAKEKPVVGIRADMDALPILEKTGLAFQSQHKGFMHACGHDAHMTNGLIAAKVLSQLKEKIPGTIVFVFQPCEEGAPGGSPSGASRMIGEGLLENPKIEAMVGLHVMPGYGAGTVALREGPLMANVASVFITIHGKASHGAFPHKGVDAIYAASAAVMQFQSLISRFRDPNERAVLTIGKIKGGVRLNVIADRVEMEGTVRTFSFETQDMIERGMENILKGLGTSLGITYDFRFEKAAKYVKNDKVLTGRVLPVFRRLLGDKNVVITEPVTIGEDFAAYSHVIPSFFFFLGAGEEGALHTPTFSVDEALFNYGPLLLSTAALEAMKKE
ncbi:MAG: amidohydrolase [bacterium]|nr:amidohydrolase [bacterium]